MSILDPAKVIEYQNQFITAVQQKGSKLRDSVYVKPITGSATRFDIAAGAQTVKNRPSGTVLSTDTDSAITNVQCTVDQYESWRQIRKLDEFEMLANARQEYADLVAYQLGRSMDDAILGAMSASNTSAGSAAAMSMSLITQVSQLTNTYDWNTPNMTWVVTPAVFAYIQQITQFGSRDYNDGQPLRAGKPVTFMGWNFIVSSVLQTPTYGNGSLTATTHTTYAFSNEQGVGLAMAKDLTTDVGWREDLRAYQVVADGIWGAVTIQPKCVLKVQITLT